MAFEEINPLAFLWRRAGLAHILLDEAQIAAMSQQDKQVYHAGAAQAPANSSDANISDANFSGPNLRAAKSSATSFPQKISRPDEPAISPQSDIQQRPAKNSGRPEWRPVPVKDFPPAWREQFEKTKGGRAAWCYRDLALDLNSPPADDIALEARRHRSKFLQELIIKLKQPGGTHTFWPCALLENGELMPDPDIFWSGLYHLGCRILFIFGQEAFDMCGIPADVPFVYRGCVYYKLDDVNTLLSRQDGVKKTVGFMDKVFKKTP